MQILLDRLAEVLVLAERILHARRVADSAYLNPWRLQETATELRRLGDLIAYR